MQLSYAACDISVQVVPSTRVPAYSELLKLAVAVQHGCTFIFGSHIFQGWVLQLQDGSLRSRLLEP